MKRILITLGVLLGIITALPSFGYASSTPQENTITPAMREESSLYIEPAALENTDLGPNDNIIRVYNTSISFFWSHSSIDEFLDSDYSDTQFYVILYSTGELKFYDEYAGLRSTEGSMFHRDLPAIYFYDDPIKKLSPDITVYNLYYLSCATNMQSSVLWYETDMGEYVYYAGAGGLLMPSDVFIDYIRGWLKNKRGYNGGSWEEVDIDISPYAINADTFDPSVLIGTVNTGNQAVEGDPGKPDNTPWIIAASGAAVAAVAVAAVLILRKRKVSKA